MFIIIKCHGNVTPDCCPRICEICFEISFFHPQPKAFLWWTVQPTVMQFTRFNGGHPQNVQSTQMMQVSYDSGHDFLLHSEIIHVLYDFIPIIIVSLVISISFAVFLRCDVIASTSMVQCVQIAIQKISCCIYCQPREFILTGLKIGKFQRFTVLVLQRDFSVRCFYCTAQLWLHPTWSSIHHLSFPRSLAVSVAHKESWYWLDR